MGIRVFRAAFIGAVTAGVFVATVASATDHIDGGMAVGQPTTDLTDLYAFTAGEDQQRLVIILNAVTAATDGTPPAPDATFNILIGSATPDADSARFQLSDADAFRISCTWGTPEVQCTTSSGLEFETSLSALNDPADIRFFAGLRSDPFNLNGRWAVEVQSGTTIPAPFDSNVIYGLNVYGLVLDIDLARVLPDLRDTVLAIGADVRDGSGAIHDRIGRPEIANIALQQPGGDDLRNALNSEPALHLSAPVHADVLQRLRANLDRYDALDPQPFLSDKDALAGLLADDFLTIDPRLPCTSAQFFDLETALLSGTAATQCGGRPLDQDIIDAVYGLLIYGDATQDVPDGADTATVPSLDAFPYLAPPNTGWQSVVRARAARVLADVSVPGPKRTQVALVAGFGLLGVLALIAVLLRRLISRRH